MSGLMVERTEAWCQFCVLGCPVLQNACHVEERNILGKMGEELSSLRESESGLEITFSRFSHEICILKKNVR